MTKQYNVITMDKDLAVVVDKEVKQDDIIIEIVSKIIGVYQYDKLHGTHDLCIPEKAFPFNTPEYFRKIVGVITETPMKDFPLAGLPLVVLPEFEQLDRWIKEESDYWYEKTGSLTSIDIVKRAASLGYKAAQQKGIYTEEDLRKAITMARMVVEEAGKRKESFEVDRLFGLTEVCTHNMDLQYTPDQIIQSLQPKRFPVSVELEWEHERDHMLPFSEWLKINPDNTIHPVNVYWS